MEPTSNKKLGRVEFSVAKQKGLIVEALSTAAFCLSGYRLSRSSFAPSHSGPGLLALCALGLSESDHRAKNCPGAPSTSNCTF